MRTRVLWFVAGVTACVPIAQESLPAAPEESFPAAREFRISPENLIMTAGGSQQFHAKFLDGAVAPVTWQVNTAAATITSGGFFTSKTCISENTAQVSASLLADPSWTAHAQVFFVGTAIANVSIMGILRVPGGTPAQFDSVVGSVDVLFSFNAGTTPCSTVASARFESVIGSPTGSLVVPIDSVTFSPNLTARQTYAFRWNTTAFANGQYAVRAVARMSDGNTASTTPFGLLVRNP